MEIHDLEIQETMEKCIFSKGEIVPKVKTPTGKTRVKIRIENDLQGSEIQNVISTLLRQISHAMGGG